MRAFSRVKRFVPRIIVFYCKEEKREEEREKDTGVDCACVRRRAHAYVHTHARAYTRRGGAANFEFL